MKAVKSLEQGLLINYFTLNDKFYYPITILTFFDFKDPSRPLSEQEMWTFLQSEWGSDQILDQGMPKPRSEVLIWGKCFAPKKQPVPILTASFRVGPLRKSLAVFGPRYWVPQTGGLTYKTAAPKPFLIAPLTWDNAFGGVDFPENPVGKGLDNWLSETGQLVIPLPNVEYPDQLIKSPDDRPQPAGCAPLDMMWSRRRKKIGTYDAKWFRERWPYFPDDMDWSFFNLAPDDQQMDAFFQGGEPVVLTNMHPDKPTLETNLPRLRLRLFLDQVDRMDQPKGPSTFKEIKTRLDTVWFFPHAERGVLIARGVPEVRDEEARDVLHLYIAAEDPAETPQSLEQHYELFQHQLKNPVTVKVDMAPLAEAEKIMAEAKEKLMDLPLQIKDAIARNLGEAPKPVRTPQDTLSECQKVVEACAPILDRGEKQLLEAKAQFGHLAKIDLAPLQKMKADLPKIKEQLAALSREADQAQAELKLLQKDGKETLKNMDTLSGGLWPKPGKEDYWDPESMEGLFEPGPEDRWREQGMRFLEECRNHLEQNPNIKGALRNLGFRGYHIKRSWLGINLDEKRFDPLTWGLTPDKRASDAQSELIIPAGFILPQFIGPHLNRITIWEGWENDGAWTEGTWPHGSSPKLVEGSQPEAMILEGQPGRPVVRVSDELEALLLNQELNGLCAVVALPDADTPLDETTASWLPESPQFIVTVAPENYDREKTPLEAWRKVHPQAEWLWLFEGLDLFAERRAGRNLRQWVIQALLPAWAPDPVQEISEEDLNKPGGLALLIPKFNVPLILEEIRAKLMAKAKTDLAGVQAEKDQALSQTREYLKAMGQDSAEAMKPLENLNLKLDDLLNPAKAPPEDKTNPFTALAEEQKKDWQTLNETMSALKGLVPESELSTEPLGQELTKVIQDSGQRYEQGQAALAAAQAQAAAGLPPWAKKLLAGAGFDPADPEPLRKLTREEVIIYHRENKSLAGKVLSGLDLSGLDLPGLDLRQAQIQGTKFTAANLDGADLSGALAEGADFSQASLIKANLEKGLFQQAKFIDANLSAANLGQTLLKGAMLVQANLSGANLAMAILEEADFTRAILRRVKAEKANFLQTRLPEAKLDGANLKNAFFHQANLSDTNLSGSVLEQAFFWQVQAENIRLVDSDLTNVRIMGETDMRRADFSGSRMEKPCLMNSDFSRSNFSQVQMPAGILENCNLTEADLKYIYARRTQFNHSNLSGADLRLADLMQASLRKVRLPEADLRGASLFNADVYKLGLGQTRMENVNFKRTLLEKIKEMLPRGDKK